MALINIKDLHLHVTIDHVHVSANDAKLDEIIAQGNTTNHKLNKIVMTNEELLAKLTSSNAKLDKIQTEVQALKDSVNNNPDVPQAIVDQVNALDAKLTAIDDINPDAPVEPPAEPGTA